MSHILFCSNPFSGHVRPGLPIATELVARGHEVSWYTGSRFADLVASTGARHVPLDRAPDFDEADLDATFPERGRLRAGIPQLKFDVRHVFIDPMAMQVADLRALLAERPVDLLVAESTFGAAVILSEQTGVPVVAYGITPLTSRSRDTAPSGLGMLPMAGPLGRLRNGCLNAFVERVLFGAEQRRFQEVRAALGVPRTRTFFMSAADAVPLYLHGTVPEFEYPRSDLAGNVRFVGALVPPVATGTQHPAWWGELSGDRPVVLVTQGTVKVDPAMLLEPAIEALADEDVLVVATTGGLDPAPILARHRAANVRLERFIPFADLLPHVDAVVTNGGYGGTQQALMHGLPVVAAGITEGKLEVGARVRWTGAGIDLRTDRATPDQVRTAVRSVLTDPSYRRAAQDLASRYAEYDAPRIAAGCIEGELARAGRLVTTPTR